MTTIKRINVKRTTIEVKSPFNLGDRRERLFDVLQQHSGKDQSIGIDG